VRVALVTLAALTSLAGGCSKGRRGVTILEFWALGREGEMVQKLIPEFERRDRDIRVRVQQIPWSAAHEKILTAFVGDAMPDLFQAGTTWIPELVALNALEPLDPWLRNSSRVPLEDYFHGILQTNEIDGTMYGLPWYVDTRVLFYRSDVLRELASPEPPRTWPAWLDVMARIPDSAAGRSYAILLPFGEWEPLVIFAFQLGAELLRENDQHGNFRSAPFRRAFEFYLELFRRNLAPPAGASQITSLYHDFASGYFSFYISGPWNLGEFRRRLPDSMQASWDTAPMPAPGKQYPGESIAGGASLVVVRTSPHKKAAWRLIEYLSQREQQLEFHRLTGDLPARQSAWESAELRADSRAQAFRAQLQRLRTVPRIPEWERIAHKISSYSERVVRGSMRVEEALTALDRDVDDLLEKRRWLLRRAQKDRAE
jgi:multiple sugar transport system substrate-binding protein